MQTRLGQLGLFAGVFCGGCLSFLALWFLPPSPTPEPLSSAVSVSTPDTSPSPQTEPEIRITIKAVGDTIMGTNFPSNDLPRGDPYRLFQAVQTQLQGADILFGNYEATLTNHPISAKAVNGRSVFAFRAPPEYAKALKKAGFDILTIANNHSYDFGEIGFIDTFRNLEKAGMRAVGKKGQIAYLDVKGIKVAFIGFSNYSDHNSVLDLKGTRAIVQQAKRNAQIVVVTFHAGAEGTGAMRTRNATEYFFGENRGNVVLFARTAIDSGADLLLGHGPHVVRALELYKGKLIAYSLGNFMGYRTLSTVAELGQSLVLEVELDWQGNFSSGKIHPLQLTSEGVPQPDPKGKTIRLMRSLTRQDFPKTPLAIKDDGTITVLGKQPQPNR
jgi:poly-gamma-glutamate capsule biosynthesis protein CapA/YwtB (metallophosphatase superfamily)